VPTRKGATGSASEQQLQGLARILQAVPRFIFRQQPPMNRLSPDVVHLVGDTRKPRIEACELKVVVDLVQQIPQRCSIAVAGKNQAGKTRGQLLPDGLFQNRPAHHGAGGKKPKEIAARGFIEIAIGLL